MAREGINFRRHWPTCRRTRPTRPPTGTCSGSNTLKRHKTVRLASAIAAVGGCGWPLRQQDERTGNGPAPRRPVREGPRLSVVQVADEPGGGTSVSTQTGTNCGQQPTDRFALCGFACCRGRLVGDPEPGLDLPRDREFRCPPCLPLGQNGPPGGASA